MNRLLVFIIAVVLQIPPVLAADGWKAGAAKVVITPDEPVWMSGYNRDHRSEGKDQDLWAKALALEDANGHRAVLITMDLIGLDRPTSQRICEQLKTRYGLERRQIALNASHTHCGPVVGRNLDGLFNLDAADWERIDNYTRQLIEKLVGVAGESIEHLQPCKIACGLGFSTIAVNRRTNKGLDLAETRNLGLLQGPSDYDVPVLTARDENGKLQAVVFGYACHATVLDAEYKWSGDFPGFAQAAMEESHPGAVVLFWAGCGGDQAPRPKGTMEMTEAYGRRLAAAVDEVLGGHMRPLHPSLAMSYDEIDLRLAAPPTRDELRVNADSKNEFVARLSRRLLSELDEGKPLRKTYPYPVQLWRLGDQQWIFLGGEVVVDYAIRLKARIRPRHLGRGLLQRCYGLYSFAARSSRGWLRSGRGSSLLQLSHALVGRHRRPNRATGASRVQKSCSLIFVGVSPCLLGVALRGTPGIAIGDEINENEDQDSDRDAQNRGLLLRTATPLKESNELRILQTRGRRIP